ncbi:MAG: glycosyltransferase family 4 protein [Vicinamibacterales bacterium]
MPRTFTITHTVSSLQVGGMERVVLQLAHAQQQAGHRVTVLALRGGVLESEAATRGLAVQVLSGGRVARGLQALQSFFKSQPDIVHVHNPTSLHYAVLSKFVGRAAIVVTLHSDFNTHARLGTKFEWGLTSAVVAVSRAAANTHRLPGSPVSLSVIHNGISLPHDGSGRHTMRADFGWTNELVGIIVARIDGRKGHRTLLESFHELHQSDLPVRLLIVGDGQERANVERLAQERGLGPDIVRILGSRSDIDALLDASDFFVLPSDREGLPLSVLEAMAHGLPVIASNVGGIPEVVEHGKEGLLIPPGDPHALAAAIRQLASNAQLRLKLGAAALERARGQFSLAATVQNYQRIYESARQ